MSNRDREKASDIFKKTDFLFGKKVSFKDAFPSIQEINVEVKEYEDFWKKGDNYSLYPHTTIFNNQYLPKEYIDCTNTICHNGGFHLGSIIREMLRNKETFKEGQSKCQGNEGSPKGRRIYRSCMHIFDYKVTIKYRD